MPAKYTPAEYSRHPGVIFIGIHNKHVPKHLRFCWRTAKKNTRWAMHSHGETRFELERSVSAGAGRLIPTSFKKAFFSDVVKLLAVTNL
jgi:hypothetical protein